MRVNPVIGFFAIGAQHERETQTRTAQNTLAALFLSCRWLWLALIFWSPHSRLVIFSISFKCWTVLQLKEQPGLCLRNPSRSSERLICNNFCVWFSTRENENIRSFWELARSRDASVCLRASVQPCNCLGWVGVEKDRGMDCLPPSRIPMGNMCLGADWLPPSWNTTSNSHWKQAPLLSLHKYWASFAF